MKKKRKTPWTYKYRANHFEKLQGEKNNIMHKSICNYQNIFTISMFREICLYPQDTYSNILFLFVYFTCKIFCIYWCLSNAKVSFSLFLGGICRGAVDVALLSEMLLDRSFGYNLDKSIRAAKVWKKIDEILLELSISFENLQMDIRLSDMCTQLIRKFKHVYVL